MSIERKCENCENLNRAARNQCCGACPTDDLVYFDPNRAALASEVSRLGKELCDEREGAEKLEKMLDAEISRKQALAKELASERAALWTAQQKCESLQSNLDATSVALDVVSEERNRLERERDDLKRELASLKSGALKN